MSWQRDLAREAATTEDVERLRELSTHRLTRVRVADATHRSSPPDVLTALAEDRHHLPRYALMNNGSPEAVAAALGSSYGDVRMVLAQRHDLDDPVYEALFADPSWEVRVSLVTSTDRPDLVARAARSADHRVRAAAAQRDLCSDEDFEMLSRDPRAEVRGEVATRPDRLTPRMIGQLRTDRSADVRWTLLSHLRGGETLRAVAAELSDDPDEIVRGHARHRLGREPFDDGA